LNFARRAPWQEAVCASVSELVSADYWKTLLEALSGYYKKPDAKASDFFTNQAIAAKPDYDLCIAAITDYFTNREDQDYALDIMQFKLDILWTCLDTLNLAMSGPDLPPTLEPRKKTKGATPKRSQKKRTPLDKNEAGEKTVVPSTAARKKTTTKASQAELPDGPAEALDATDEAIKNP